MRKASVLVAIVLVCFVAAGGVWAAMDIFLKIDDIKGESTNDKHKDEIEVLSWSWGMTVPATSRPGGGGAGTGRVDFTDLAITKFVDKATPGLFKALVTGDHISKATLYIVQSGKTQFNMFQLVMSDILVTSLTQGSSAAGADLKPIEQISLYFGKVEMTYTPQKADGSPDASISYGWDLSEQTKF